jgi:molybdate transport system substrate-binding protein
MMLPTRGRAPRIALALLVALVVPAAAGAAEITVLCPRLLQRVIADAAAEFQRTTRHETWLVYGPGDGIVQRASTEPAVDIVIASVAAMAQLEAKGAVRRGTRVVLGRVGLGVAVRAGTPPLDVSNPANLRRAILQATSLGYVDPARDASVGGHLVQVLEGIGIAPLVRPKTTLFPEGKGALDRVARGDIALAFAAVSEIRGAEGVELAGPLPPPVQQLVVYAAAVLTRSAAPDVAAAFLAHLGAAATRARLKAGGVDPGD